MTWKVSIAGLLLIALASCSSSDLGTGINTVDREYAASVKDAHEAALSTLKAQNLHIESDKADSLGASVVAKRGASDDKVVVDVKAVDKTKTRVSVRVQPGDKEQATAIQERIGEKLAPAAR